METVESAKEESSLVQACPTDFMAGQLIPILTIQRPNYQVSEPPPPLEIKKSIHFTSLKDNILILAIR